MPNDQNRPTDTETLAGLVERVTFHNGENGVCVLGVKPRGQRERVTVVGHAATIAAGEREVGRFGWTFAPGDQVIVPPTCFQDCRTVERRPRARTVVFATSTGGPGSVPISGTLLGPPPQSLRTRRAGRRGVLR